MNTSGLAKLGMIMQATGMSLNGQNGMSIYDNYSQDIESQKRKANVQGLLDSMNLPGPKRAFLEMLPFEQQSPIIWDLLNPKPMGGGGGGRAPTQEERANAYLASLTGGGAVPQPAPQQQGGGFSMGVPDDFGAPVASAGGLSLGQPTMESPAPATTPGLSFGNLPQSAPEPVASVNPYDVLRDRIEEKLLFAQEAAFNGNPDAMLGVQSLLKQLEQVNTISPPNPMQEIDRDVANAYRDDLKSEPSVANFQLVRSGLDTIEELYRNPGAVSDYALAVGFAKIVDPGSVAREGEVAAVQGSTALSDRLKQQVINALNGTGALPEESRKEIADLAARFYNRSADRAGTVLESYRARADRANIPFDEIWAGGDIEELPDDWVTQLQVNPNAQERFAPAPVPTPAPAPVPQPAPPPVRTVPEVPQAQTVSPAAQYSEKAIKSAIDGLTAAQLSTLGRIKGVKNQISYLKRLGVLK